MMFPIDLSTVDTSDLEAELLRRRRVPRLTPPGPDASWARAPVSTLVDVVCWAPDPIAHRWGSCGARLLSPVSGIDALDITSVPDLDDVVKGLSMARALVADPSTGWTPVHRGLSARAHEDAERLVFATARGLRWK